MDRKLIEAAQKGDVHQLHNLIKDDPFLLRAVALSGGQTPLHIACMGGKLNFVKEVLNLMPEFAKELSQDGFSPLHIAAANGDLEIVKELLKMDENLSLIKGKDRRIPLHLAVIKGRIEVIKELLSNCVDSIGEATARAETSLHLAVKNNQFEALKSLVEHLKAYNKEDIMNNKDTQGNTILHLAGYRKQYEVVELVLDENLVSKGMLELNSLNKRGLTPLDVLLSEGSDCEIEEMFKLAGATGFENVNTGQQAMQSENGTVSTRNASHDQQSRQRPSKKLQDYFKYDKTKDSPSQVRNTLLVVAVLIATTTYQAVLSPPGGVWQDNFVPSNNTTITNDVTLSRPEPAHTAGKSVMGTQNTVSFGLFLVFNSIGFFMSVHMLYFLTARFPLQLELQVALCALIATYDTSMGAIAPGGKLSLFFIIVSIVMPLLMPILTRMARDYRKTSRCVSSSTTARA